MINIGILFFILLSLFIFQRPCYSRFVQDSCEQVPISSQNNQYLLLGHHDSNDKGLGNRLVFFPAAFYFSIFSYRHLIINDTSPLGQLCNVVQCGFPLYSTFNRANPAIFSTLNLENIPIFHPKFMKDMAENKTFFNPYPVISLTGYDSKSDWWVWYRSLAECVGRISGCDAGDVSCAERYAFQSLIQGPFLLHKISNVSKFYDDFQGIEYERKVGIFELPHKNAPRFDFAFHIRNEFRHFEGDIVSQYKNETYYNKFVGSQDYFNEVQTWLNSTEKDSLFDMFLNKIADDTQGITRHISIFVASDDSIVKREFIAALKAYPKLSGRSFSVAFMNHDNIVHIKYLNQLKSSNDGMGFSQMVLDWYCLSLSNIIYSFRRGFGKGLSTFLLSAQRMSGSKERTNLEQGNSVGTKAYQLMKNKRGNLYFSHIWISSTIDINQI